MSTEEQELGQIVVSIELDQVFNKTKAAALELLGQADRFSQIRVRKWLTKLSEPTSNNVWRRNRNSYAKLLLDQLRHGGPLQEPFDVQPMEGPLPTLPHYMKYRYASSPRSLSATPEKAAKRSTASKGGLSRGEGGTPTTAWELSGTSKPNIKSSPPSQPSSRAKVCLAALMASPGHPTVAPTRHGAASRGKALDPGRQHSRASHSRTILQPAGVHGGGDPSADHAQPGPSKKQAPSSALVSVIPEVTALALQDELDSQLEHARNMEWRLRQAELQLSQQKDQGAEQQHSLEHAYGAPLSREAAARSGKDRRRVAVAKMQLDEILDHYGRIEEAAVDTTSKADDQEPPRPRAEHGAATNTGPSCTQELSKYLLLFEEGLGGESGHEQGDAAAADADRLHIHDLGMRSGVAGNTQGGAFSGARTRAAASVPGGAAQSQLAWESSSQRAGAEGDARLFQFSPAVMTALKHFSQPDHEALSSWIPPKRQLPPGFGYAPCTSLHAGHTGDMAPDELHGAGSSYTAGQQQRRQPAAGGDAARGASASVDHAAADVWLRLQQVAVSTDKLMAVRAARAKVRESMSVHPGAYPVAAANNFWAGRGRHQSSGAYQGMAGGTSLRPRSSGCGFQSANAAATSANMPGYPEVVTPAYRQPVAPLLLSRAQPASDSHSHAQWKFSTLVDATPMDSAVGHERGNSLQVTSAPARSHPTSAAPYTVAAAKEGIMRAVAPLAAIVWSPPPTASRSHQGPRMRFRADAVQDSSTRCPSAGFQCLEKDRTAAAASLSDESLSFSFLRNNLMVASSVPLPVKGSSEFVAGDEQHAEQSHWDTQVQRLHAGVSSSAAPQPTPPVLSQELGYPVACANLRLNIQPVQEASHAQHSHEAIHVQYSQQSSHVQHTHQASHVQYSSPEHLRQRAAMPSAAALMDKDPSGLTKHAVRRMDASLDTFQRYAAEVRSDLLRRWSPKESADCLPPCQTPFRPSGRTPARSTTGVSPHKRQRQGPSSTETGRGAGPLPEDEKRDFQLQLQKHSKALNGAFSHLRTSIELLRIKLGLNGAGGGGGVRHHRTRTPTRGGSSPPWRPSGLPGCRGRSTSPTLSLSWRRGRSRSPVKLEGYAPAQEGVGHHPTQPLWSPEAGTPYLQSPQIGHSSVTPQSAATAVKTFAKDMRNVMRRLRTLDTAIQDPTHAGVEGHKPSLPMDSVGDTGVSAPSRTPREQAATEALSPSQDLLGLLLKEGGAQPDSASLEADGAEPRWGNAQEAEPLPCTPVLDAFENHMSSLARELTCLVTSDTGSSDVPSQQHAAQQGAEIQCQELPNACEASHPLPHEGQGVAGRGQDAAPAAAAAAAAGPEGASSLEWLTAGASHQPQDANAEPDALWMLSTERLPAEGSHPPVDQDAGPGAYMGAAAYLEVGVGQAHQTGSTAPPGNNVNQAEHATALDATDTSRAGHAGSSWGNTEEQQGVEESGTGSAEEQQGVKDNTGMSEEPLHSGGSAHGPISGQQEDSSPELLDLPVNRGRKEAGASCGTDDMTGSITSPPDGTLPCSNAELPQVECVNTPQLDACVAATNAMSQEQQEEEPQQQETRPDGGEADNSVEEPQQQETRPDGGEAYNTASEPQQQAELSDRECEPLGVSPGAEIDDQVTDTGADEKLVPHDDLDSPTAMHNDKDPNVSPSPPPSGCHADPPVDEDTHTDEGMHNDEDLHVSHSPPFPVSLSAEQTVDEAQLDVQGNSVALNASDCSEQGVPADNTSEEGGFTGASDDLRSSPSSSNIMVINSLPLMPVELDVVDAVTAETSQDADEFVQRDKESMHEELCILDSRTSRSRGSGSYDSDRFCSRASSSACSSRSGGDWAGSRYAAASDGEACYAGEWGQVEPFISGAEPFSALAHRPPTSSAALVENNSIYQQPHSSSRMDCVEGSAQAGSTQAGSTQAGSSTAAAAETVSVGDASRRIGVGWIPPPALDVTGRPAVSLLPAPLLRELVTEDAAADDADQPTPQQHSSFRTPDERDSTQLHGQQQQQQVTQVMITSACLSPSATNKRKHSQTEPLPEGHQSGDSPDQDKADKLPGWLLGVGESVRIMAEKEAQHLDKFRQMKAGLRLEHEDRLQVCPPPRPLNISSSADVWRQKYAAPDLGTSSMPDDGLDRRRQLQREAAPQRDFTQAKAGPANTSQLSFETVQREFPTRRGAASTGYQRDGNKVYMQGHNKNEPDPLGSTAQVLQDAAAVDRQYNQMKHSLRQSDVSNREVMAEFQRLKQSMGLDSGLETHMQSYPRQTTLDAALEKAVTGSLVREPSSTATAALATTSSCLSEATYWSLKKGLM